MTALQMVINSGLEGITEQGRQKGIESCPWHLAAKTAMTHLGDSGFLRTTGEGFLGSCEPQHDGDFTGRQISASVQHFDFVSATGFFLQHAQLLVASPVPVPLFLAVRFVLMPAAFSRFAAARTKSGSFTWFAFAQSTFWVSVKQQHFFQHCAAD